MKRKALAFFLAAMLLCGPAIPASANGWNLTGKLLAAVEAAHDWHEYTRIGNQAGDFAVLHARYHNALLWVDKGGALHAYTAAVYQPDKGCGHPTLTLEHQGACDTLTIAYDGEAYVFIAGADEDWYLREARIGFFRLSLNTESAGGEDDRYDRKASDGAETAVFRRDVPLAEFNIDLFPRSVDEVRRLNHMAAALDSGDDCLGCTRTGASYTDGDWGELLPARGSGTAPVYGAPWSEGAWRAGQGKAAVGLHGDIWLLRRHLNEAGETWACVRCFVSRRTQRLGWVRAEALGLSPLEENGSQPGEQFVKVDVEAVCDTFLTDDPDVSQFRQFSVPAGTQFACLGLYNAYYAYVAAEVRNGRFTDGGQIVWGFVPMKDLAPMKKAVRQDVMDALAGEWDFYAGGSMADDHLILRADGTFEGWDIDWDNWDAEPNKEEYIGPLRGVWYVTDYASDQNLYWNGCPYEMTLLYDNGSANVKGLSVDDSGDSFGLTYWEGGGGYLRRGAPDPWAEE